ncbi:MAG: signal peptide peptidase SppA [Planctomycetota bacterium]|nr:signal peptide peptidase SppA [Planctomycetota bacterium]
MKANVLTALLVGIFLFAGCGPSTGWIVKPVPLRARLTETVLASDRGLFVADKIVLLDADGLLVNRRSQGAFSSGENPVSLFVEKLDKAQADPQVKAVVLRINSPGGSVTACDIMYRKLMEFRAAKTVPVVAIFEDVGASGAYYLACGADSILAHPTSVTGSIGVLVQTFSFSGTMKLIGIKARAVTSGPRKDLASPFKPLDEKDIAILQGLVDEYYRRFLEVVRTSRQGIDPERLKPLADGRVFTGRAAAENGLVDAVGYMDDAVALAKKLSGAKHVKIVMYHRPPGYRANVYSEARLPTASQVNLLNVSAGDLLDLGRPQFLYLWMGKTSGR